MKAKVLKRDNRFETRNDRSLGVQTYGESNDYPQMVVEIVDASCTGGSCVDIYAKFISGRGFVDTDFYKMVVNGKGQSNDYILDQISKDYATFGGFALHVNYNANLKATSLQHVPFETIRLEKLNDETSDFERVATHPDWGRRLTNLRKWKKDDIQFYHLFNPELVSEQVIAAGGWANYKGQIFYFSNEGEKTYPLPIFDSELTDMNTEEGISNVSNRNVRSNFLTAGMFINYVNDNKNAAGRIEEEDKGRTQDNGIETALKGFQGDEKAGKMLYIELEDGDTKPEFVSFKGTNYDKEFNVTEESVQNNIGRVFNQPPILRAENVGANFGADLMKNAYDYYNSVIENERLNVERVYTSIFQHWFTPTTGDYSIIPLSYDVKMTLAERIGEKGFDQLVKVIENGVLSTIQKRNMAKRLFDLSDEELNDLIPLV